MWFRRSVDDNTAWVGLSHGGGVLHAARASHAPGEKPRLLSLDHEPTGDLAEGLQHLVSQKRLPKDARLCGVLERSQYRLLSIDVPDIPQAEWRDAMRWRLKDYVEFPMDDALLDVLAVPENTQIRQQQSAMAYVMQRVDFNRWFMAADDVGRKWRALETPETSLRVLCAMAETTDEAHAMLVFGQAYALLLITMGGDLVMTRNIEVNVDALDGDTEARGSALGRASLEVLRTLDSFERMHSEARLAAMSVVSPTGNDDIIEVLSDLIYVPVRKYVLQDWVDVSALGNQAERIGKSGHLEEYAAIGAALRGHAQQQTVQLLNLMDARELQQGKVSWNANMGAALMAAVAGGAILAGGIMTAWTGYVNRRIAQLEEEVQRKQSVATTLAVPKEFQQVKDMKSQEARQQQLTDAMRHATQQTTEPYSTFLTALARQRLDGLWITHLSVRDQGLDVNLTGRMVDPARLPAYLQRLQAEPQFQGRRFAQVDIRALNNEPGVNTQVIEFTLTGKPDSNTSGKKPQRRREEDEQP